MSRCDMSQCDHCGKRVDNPFAAKGWLQIDGHITRAAGFYSRGSYATDYIGRDRSDFCSLRCLEKALDKAASERTRKATSKAA